MFREENNSDPIRQPFHSHFLVTAAMICGGLVMYPIGWDNREVRESCGKGANVYNLGEYIPFPPRKIVHFVMRVSLYVLPYRRGMEKLVSFTKHFRIFSRDSNESSKKKRKRRRGRKK